jgi:hypothetical protein
MPEIVVINEADQAVNSDAQVLGWLQAFQQQWNQDLRQVWGVDQANFTFLAKGGQASPGSWWLVFLNDSNQADALAYHDLTNEGLPISKVFVKTILSDHSSISVGATHELCEMAVDPWLNSAYQDPKGTFWAGEVCDPVEDDQYGYEIGGIVVTDFVTPDWFAHAHSQGPIDFQKHAQSAFQVLTGGYAQYFDPQHGWQQITGNKAKRSARATTPPVGSRRERRARKPGAFARSPLKFAGRR